MTTDVSDDVKTTSQYLKRYSIGVTTTLQNCIHPLSRIFARSNLMMTTYVPCSRSSPSHECIYSTPWYMVLVPWWVPVMKNVPVCRRIYNFRPYILTDFRIQALVCLRAALLFSRLNCFSCIHFKRPRHSQQYIVKLLFKHISIKPIFTIRFCSISSSLPFSFSQSHLCLYLK